MTAVTFGVVVACTETLAEERGGPWEQHTIDDSSRGADGVRPLDVNRDGRLDLVTGWEEGGIIRVYLHPGRKKVRQEWPVVTVGKVASPEDAVFVDLDQDGAIDVVSCCEGKTLSVHAHWAPKLQDQLLDPSAWTTDKFSVLDKQQAFMFCLPMNIDAQRGIDLIIGSKSHAKHQFVKTQVGWLRSPGDPRRMSDWSWHSIYEAGWIMSLIGQDMDHDGDRDVLLTDRKGESRGCKWLENPGTDRVTGHDMWQQHLIGGANKEVMFADSGDIDQDGLQDVVTATQSSGLVIFRRLDDTGDRWQSQDIAMPPQTGAGKAVKIGDINLDNTMDLVVTCEHANDKHGVFWLQRNSEVESNWLFRPISGTPGVKFDLIQLIDLDDDGDSDVLTCEERSQLGVIWYENPTR